MGHAKYNVIDHWISKENIINFPELGKLKIKPQTQKLKCYYQKDDIPLTQWIRDEVAAIC